MKNGEKEKRDRFGAKKARENLLNFKKETIMTVVETVIFPDLPETGNGFAKSVRAE